MPELSPVLNFTLKRIIRVPVQYPAAQTVINVRIFQHYNVTARILVANDNSA